MPPRTKKPESNGRPVVHPLYRSVWHVNDPATVAPGQEVGPPIDSELSVNLLALKAEEPGGPKFGNDYLFIDRKGKKVRCENNIRNRPLYTSNVEDRVQDILRVRWELNGEPIIIGKTGIDLNGQHTLVAVYLAQQDLELHPELWAANFPGGKVSIQKVINYGIAEEDRVVNTMDTCRPRSIPDMIYRSPYFRNFDSIRRFEASRMLDHAIRALWGRTGVMIAGANYSMKRTHPEVVDFVETHKKLLQCVKHVLEVNKDGGVSAWVGAGYASACLYLMGASETNPDDYYAQDVHTEKPIKWTNFEKACGFWDEFAKPTEEAEDAEGKKVPASQLACLHKAIHDLTKEDGTPGSISEKDYLVVQAWKKWLAKGKVTPKDLDVKYSPPDNKGRRHIIEAPDFGGIDLGLNFVIPKTNQEPTLDEVNGHEEAKEEVANGGPPMTPPGQTDWTWLAKLKESDKTVTVVFAKNSLGKFQAWSEDGQIASEVCGLPYKLHPKGLSCVTIEREDIEGVADKLTDAGHVVGFADEVEPYKYEFQTIYRPKPTKKGGKSK